MSKEKMTKEERELFCKLLEDAMEGSSYAEYAKRSGVSASNISRIKKSEYRPHPDVLKKLTSSVAMPANNVSYAMLRRAVGYEDEETLEELANSGYDFAYQVVGDHLVFHDLVHGQEDFYDIKCLGIICATLFKAGIAYLNIKNGKQIGLRNLKPDIMMSLPEKGNKGMVWLIENMINPGHKPVSMISHLYSYFWEVANPKFKVSVVVSDLELFKHTITTYKNRISYRGDLSIILVDLDKDQVVDEVYLSHYYEEEKKQKKTEFYITETNDSES